MREESSFSAIFVPERSRSISHFVNDIGNFLNYRADYRCFVCGVRRWSMDASRSHLLRVVVLWWSVAADKLRLLDNT